jgi:tRNA dimethylallyltransferase
MTQATDKPKLLALVGPTAVGKTSISLDIAERYGCEIISGDSMQVYRGMDIGTAKISAEERRRIPHHMIDIHDPDYPFSAAEFQEEVKRCIRDIHARGKLPFLVGGTGLYIESVCYDYRFVEGGADEAFREELRRFAQMEGTAGLYERLKEVDPATAARLHPNDQRRIIRALEIAHVTGKPLSAQMEGKPKESPYRLCIIGLTMERQLLYKRIDARVDDMIEKGLVEEVRGLMERGITRGMVSMQGLGYKEIASYLSGECGLEEAVERIKRNTRRFAKRQLSWFRHMKDIVWVDVSDSSKFSAHFHQINDIIAGKLGIHQEYISKASEH